MNKHVSAALKTVALITSLTLAGCAGYAPSNEFIGLSKNQTLSLLGNPTPMPANIDSARRLDFPRGPVGKHTYSVYFDEQGKVTGYHQLLTDENFAKIVPGMDESEVTDLIGISKDRFGLGRERGYVWNYRYETPLCRWFQIEFTPESKVRSAGYSIPPECKVGTRAIR
jgi:hypothetical protein